METEVLKKVMRQIVPRRPSLHILTQAKVKGSMLYATDLDRWLIADTDLPDGWIDAERFIKYGDLKAAFTPCESSELTPEDFPMEPDFVIKAQVDPVSFAAFSDAATYANTDTTRATLTGVYLGAGKMCATDGHALREAPIPYEGPGIIVPASAAPLIKLLDDSMGVAVVQDVKNTAREFISFRGPGYEVSVKLVDGPYPDYRKIIPQSDLKKLTVKSSTLCAMLAGLKALKPYVNEKTSLVYLQGNTIGTRSDAGYWYDVELPERVAPLDETIGITLIDELTEEESTIQVPYFVCFGGDYLVHILQSAINTGAQEVTIAHWKSNIAAVQFLAGGDRFLIMPMNINCRKDISGVYPTDPLRLEAAPVKAPAPKKAKLDKRLERVALHMQEAHGVQAVLDYLGTFDLVGGA